MYLIVGLGNPGKEYEQTRHNIGFMAVERWIQSLGFLPEKKEKKALINKFKWQGKDIILARPQTFMNLSGESVSPLLAYYKVELDNLLIVHDEIDLAYDSMKMQRNRGHGGQNGIRNIHQQLGSKDYCRLRLGVGKPSHPGQDVASWVLSKFKTDEQKTLDAFLNDAVDSIESFILDGPMKAMEKTNTRKK
ncbi:MAG: aminoacyl-tRNA hydrolase [Bdellovibrionales bacterium]